MSTFLDFRSDGHHFQQFISTAIKMFVSNNLIIHNSPFRNLASRDHHKFKLSVIYVNFLYYAGLDCRLKIKEFENDLLIR